MVRECGWVALAKCLRKLDGDSRLSKFKSCGERGGFESVPVFYVSREILIGILGHIERYPFCEDSCTSYLEVTCQREKWLGDHNRVMEEGLPANLVHVWWGFLWPVCVALGCCSCLGERKIGSQLGHPSISQVGPVKGMVGNVAAVNGCQCGNVEIALDHTIHYSAGLGVSSAEVWREYIQNK